jgi:hypothetical protein
LRKKPNGINYFGSVRAADMFAAIGEPDPPAALERTAQRLIR